MQYYFTSTGNSHHAMHEQGAKTSFLASAHVLTKRPERSTLRSSSKNLKREMGGKVFVKKQEIFAR